MKLYPFLEKAEVMFHMIHCIFYPKHLLAYVREWPVFNEAKTKLKLFWNLGK